MVKKKISHKNVTEFYTSRYVLKGIVMVLFGKEKTTNKNIAREISDMREGMDNSEKFNVWIHRKKTF
jgi:hypothetical protein